MIEDTRPIYTWNNRTFRSRKDLYAAVMRSWKKGVLRDPMNKYAHFLKLAENQEYEPEETPAIDPNEESDEDKKEQEEYSVKRNPLKRKVKKKKKMKKEPIPKREDLDFKNDLDEDDPQKEQKMAEKIASRYNYYTNLIYRR